MAKNQHPTGFYLWDVFIYPGYFFFSFFSFRFSLRLFFGFFFCSLLPLSLVAMIITPFIY